MNIVTNFDLIQAISGVNAQGFGKCIVSLQLRRQDAEGNVKNIGDELVVEKPILQMFKQAGGFILVDFIFDSIDDVELHRMHTYLQKFAQATNSTSDDELDFPLLVFTIVPEEYEGHYFVAGINPIYYALTSNDVNGEMTTIRTAFYIQDDKDMVPNFLFLEANEEALDDMIEDIDYEAVNEIADETFVETIDENIMVN